MEGTNAAMQKIRAFTCMLKCIALPRIAPASSASGGCPDVGIEDGPVPPEPVAHRGLTRWLPCVTTELSSEKCPHEAGSVDRRQTCFFVFPLPRSYFSRGTTVGLKVPGSGDLGMCQSPWLTVSWMHHHQCGCFREPEQPKEWHTGWGFRCESGMTSRPRRT